MDLYNLWLLPPFIGLYLCFVAIGAVWQYSRLLAIPTIITLTVVWIAASLFSAQLFLEGLNEQDRTDKQLKRMENAEKTMERIEGGMTDTERERMLKIIDAELARMEGAK